MSKTLNNATSIFLLFLTSSCLSGCDLPKSPEKIEGLPNTFRREALRTKEKVLSVLVRDAGGAAWLIMAVKPIDLKDFKVQVGLVPEGFEQMIPPDDQKFTPVVGNRYSIGIMTDVRNHSCAYVLQMSTSWTAEE